MTDLEQRLRDALEHEGRLAPEPHEARPTLRRVRRRQALAVVGSVAAAVAILGAGIVGVGALVDDGNGIPAAPTTTETLNGISITFPDGWSLIDPDAAGLNGPTHDGTEQLPRLLLMLAPQRSVDAFGCPEQFGGSTDLVMSVQQEPLVVGGGSAALWPTALEPMSTMSATGGCYGGWEFSQAIFTTGGRSFDVRVGFAPDVEPSDRDALLAAYASMTFEPATDPPTTVTLASGSVGGDDWDLVASHGSDGLDLSLNTTSQGAGIGGLDPESRDLQIGSANAGADLAPATIVFGAVPTDVVRIEIEFSTLEPPVEASAPLDVPDAIDPALNAFVVVVPRGAEGSIRALDAEGDVVAVESLPGARGSIETPLPGISDGKMFGFVRGIDLNGRTVDVDDAEWLSGDAANEAWQAAGNTGPVPNDHFVVNDDPTPRTLPLAPDVELVLLNWNHCCDIFFEGDLETFARAIAEQRDVEVDGVVYRGQSSWWLTVRDGVVTKIHEQYAP
jgi:hypothetical protein